MKGLYRIYTDDGVAEFSNLITNEGKKYIGEFLAGQRSSWSQVIALGAGNASPQATDTSLQMPFWRQEIDLKTYDVTNNQIVLRTNIPSQVAGKIYELGVYSDLNSNIATYRSPVVAFFDKDTEQWDTGTSDTIFQRVGQNCLILTASSGTTSSLSTFFGDFRSYTNNTVFRLGYYADAGITNITLRVRSNASNYREYSFTPVNNATYSVESWSLSDFAVTGNADWNEFSEIQVSCTGTGDVKFDAFSGVEQDGSTVLVSRALADIGAGATSVEKTLLKEMQIEYVVDLS